MWARETALPVRLIKCIEGFVVIEQNYILVWSALIHCYDDPSAFKTHFNLNLRQPNDAIRDRRLTSDCINRICLQIEQCGDDKLQPPTSGYGPEPEKLGASTQESTQETHWWVLNVDGG